MRDPTTLLGQAYVAGDTPVDHLKMFADPRVLATEIPSGGGTGTARSLARMYAVLAAGGTLGGRRIVSPESVDKWAELAVCDVDALVSELDVPGASAFTSRPVSRTLGYSLNPALPGEPPRFGPSRRSFGAEGLGGQISFCDREHDVAVGFVRNELTLTTHLSTALIRTLYDCAGARIGHLNNGRGKD